MSNKEIGNISLDLGLDHAIHGLELRMALSRIEQGPAGLEALLVDLATLAKIYYLATEFNKFSYGVPKTETAGTVEEFSLKISRAFNDQCMDAIHTPEGKIAVPMNENFDADLANFRTRAENLGLAKVATSIIDERVFSAILPEFINGIADIAMMEVPRGGFGKESLKGELGKIRLICGECQSILEKNTSSAKEVLAQMALLFQFCNLYGSEVLVSVMNDPNNKSLLGAWIAVIDLCYELMHKLSAGATGPSDVNWAETENKIARIEQLLG